MTLVLNGYTPHAPRPMPRLMTHSLGVHSEYCSWQHTRNDQARHTGYRPKVQSNISALHSSQVSRVLAHGILSSQHGETPASLDQPTGLQLHDSTSPTCTRLEQHKYKHCPSESLEIHLVSTEFFPSGTASSKVEGKTEHLRFEQIVDRIASILRERH